MNKTTVVHCMKEKYDLYVGRWNPKVPINSKWHNPFKLNKDEPRGSTLEKYKEYLFNNEKLMSELPELKGLVLGCWCGKEDVEKGLCHAAILADLANKLE